MTGLDDRPDALTSHAVGAADYTRVAAGNKDRRGKRLCCGTLDYVKSPVGRLIQGLGCCLPMSA
jgi:hypothetical protein